MKLDNTTLYIESKSLTYATKFYKRRLKNVCKQPMASKFVRLQSPVTELEAKDKFSADMISLPDELYTPSIGWNLLQKKQSILTE